MPIVKPHIHDRLIRDIASKVRMRHRTTEVTVHKSGPHGARTADEVAAFYLTDPEGVATVTLRGSYKSKVPVFKAWRRAGYIPSKNLEAAISPYHFLIEPAGAIYQHLPLMARGAHARRSNGRAFAIACVGDYDKEKPAPEMLTSLRWLIKWLVFDEQVVADTNQDQGLLDVRGHDEVRDVPKRCPGRYLLPEVVLLRPWLVGVRRQLEMTRRF